MPESLPGAAAATFCLMASSFTEPVDAEGPDIVGCEGCEELRGESVLEESVLGEEMDL